jgi:hypothetical protein
MRGITLAFRDWISGSQDVFSRIQLGNTGHTANGIEGSVSQNRLSDRRRLELL